MAFMPFTFKSTLPFLILSFANSMLIGKEPAWEKIKTEKGVYVYRAKFNENIAFRGIGLIQGDAEKLISIIENPDRWGNWIENFKHGKLLEKINANHKVFYQAINSPFPVSDRDIVYESKIFRDNPEKIRIEMKSVKHSNSPETVGVRINIIFSRYLIEKKNDQRMKVTFETSSEPGGAIPNFLANWAGRSYPVTLIEGLRREMRR